MKGSRDTLGDRMKHNYEDRYRYSISRRGYVIARIDGKAFHSYTRGLNRPFDQGLIEDMDRTAAHLCKTIMGAKFAYVQSDEINILITDFDTLDSQAWFDNNLQKMCSVGASLATSKFNHLRTIRKIQETRSKVLDISEYGMEIEKVLISLKQSEFDARFFTMPSQSEVSNYFLWRQQDATRNSVFTVASSLYSHRELHGKNSSDMQEMIFQKGINWDKYDPKLKRGRMIVKIEKEIADSFRTEWVSVECPIFNREPDFLLSKIPQLA